MSEELTTYQKLSTPFAVSEHARVPKGGMQQTYAPWTAYVERLNDVLGPDRWSFRVIREGFTETECWVLGEITATIDGETVTRQQYGCEPITKGQRETPTTDLLKTAASDAIKKAASLIGPGLYLSIKEEREAIEAEMREASRPKPPQKPATAPTPISDAARDVAVLTGAAPPKPKGYLCDECHQMVQADSSLEIQKNKKGERVTVPVDEFAPVCEARLGAFHCSTCYDRKFWGAA